MEFQYLITALAVLSNALCLVQTQTEADVRIVCPAAWTEGFTQILTCFVNASKYSNSTCKVFSNLVVFQFKARGEESGRESQECSVTNLTEACVRNRFSSKGCRCREVADEQYVLEFAVTGDRARHEGGTWRCVPGCFDDLLKNPFRHPLYADALTCGPVVFGASTSSTPAILTSSLPTTAVTVTQSTPGASTSSTPAILTSSLPTTAVTVTQSTPGNDSSATSSIRPSMTLLSPLMMMTQIYYIRFLP